MGNDGHDKKDDYGLKAERSEAISLGYQGPCLPSFRLALTVYRY